jgi:hypothetical protein
MMIELLERKVVEEEDEELSKMIMLEEEGRALVVLAMIKIRKRYSQPSTIGIYIWDDLREHRPFMVVRIELRLSPKYVEGLDHLA